jgi:hypothetical protein
VIRGRDEPTVIAIRGIGPVNYALVDPSKPPGAAGVTDSTASRHARSAEKARFRRQNARSGASFSSDSRGPPLGRHAHMRMSVA